MNRLVPPPWTSSIGACGGIGQLWLVSAVDRPLFVCTCDYKPLLQNWSNVELGMLVPMELDYSRYVAQSVSTAVLAPGPVSYEACRILFTFKVWHVKDTPWKWTPDPTEPYHLTVVVEPDFRDASVSAWYEAWKQKFRFWWVSKVRRLKRRLNVG